MTLIPNILHSAPMTFCAYHAADLGSFPTSVLGVPQNERGMAKNQTQGIEPGRSASALQNWRP